MIDAVHGFEGVFTLLSFSQIIPTNAVTFFFRKWDICLLEVRCYYGRVDGQLDDSRRLGVCLKVLEVKICMLVNFENP